MNDNNLKLDNIYMREIAGSVVISDVERAKCKVKQSKTLYFRAEELISGLIPVILSAKSIE